MNLVEMRSTAPSGRRLALTALALALALLAGALVPGRAAADVAGAAKRLQAVKQDRPKLTRFLRAMPKGTDLHTHLSGAVYAESMVRWGAADGKCVDPITLISSYPPCLDGQVPLERALTDGYTTGSGMGLGLGGARRLVNEFAVTSEVGVGTRVVIARWK